VENITIELRNSHCEVCHAIRTLGTKGTEEVDYEGMKLLCVLFECSMCGAKYRMPIIITCINREDAMKRSYIKN